VTGPKTCPSCTRPTPDGLVCQSCIERLRADLTALPGYWAELPTTIHRQAQTGDGSGGKAHEAPLPFDLTAATVRDSVINTIGTWVRELSFGDDTNLAPTMRAWCRWLLDRTQRIRGHLAAEEIIDEIHYAVSIVRQVIDRPGDSILCATCEVCGKDIRASPDAAEAVCRWCWIGGRENSYPVPARRADAWKEAESRLVTRAQVLEALVYYQIEVKPPTFRSWIHREMLKPQGYRSNGTPLYLLGAVLKLARSTDLERMTG